MQEKHIKGNLLLTGEYFITQEGGMGLSFTSKQAFIYSYEKSTVWNISILMQDGNTDIKIKKKTESLISYLEKQYNIQIPTLNLTLDSRALHDVVIKIGLGSSACLSVALCRIAFPEDSLEELGQKAVDLHRYMQDGRGSGYDVLTSLNEGFNLFVGGKKPKIHSLNRTNHFIKKDSSPLLLESSIREYYLYIYKTPNMVSSKEAVKLFEQWKKEHYSKYQNYFIEHQNLMQNLIDKPIIEAIDWKLLEELKIIGMHLGECIGCTANYQLDPKLPKPLFSKALGAGNESILLVYEDPLKGVYSNIIEV